MVWIPKFPEHGIGFAGTSLPICKNSAVVAIEDILNCISTDGIIYS